MDSSLHRRLVWLLLGAVAVTWVAAVATAAWLSRRTVLDQVDRQLLYYLDTAEHTLSSVLADSAVRDHFFRGAQIIALEPRVSRVLSFGTRSGGLGTNLWFGDHQILVGLHTPPFPPPETEGAATHRLVGPQGVSRWRIHYRRHGEQLWIATGVDLARAADFGAVTLARLLAPLLVILPLTGAALLWGVRRGLAPLRALAERIAARRPGALEAIDVRDVPREIRPVVDALNDLLARLGRALEAERRFTANAAHELQTPLAAVLAEVQLAERRAADGETRAALAQIAARVRRAAATVGQLLTLARLDPEQDFPRRPVRLDQLLPEVLAEEGALAVERRLDLAVDALPPAAVTGHSEWLAVLLRNLVGNAFRHAPPGGRVAVALEATAGGVCLRIANDCPPLEAEVWSRLGERFFTPSPGGGVGLGLSIARRVAELHGARLVLKPWRDGAGFVAEVVFPA